MLPNTRWEAAHLATWCAQKLAYLETFKADQTGMSRSKRLMSEITGAEAHSENRGGSLIAIIVRRESPSIKMKEQPVEQAKLVANRAAWASPREASIGGSFLEQAATKFPSWSRRTAAATAKVGLMATSKFAFRDPEGGGTQSAERGSPVFQAFR